MSNANGSPPRAEQWEDGTPPAPEALEREAARRRGQERAHARESGRAPARDPYSGRAAAAVAQRAFAVLAENVRDYAVFLLDPNGVITFWGESARLIKWWTKDEAEGAHLRLLYPEGGSEDGTAEAHLGKAAETGEYTGEGQRVRSDGSTFWAGVTLTALRDEAGELIGFAKVARDLTAVRAAEEALTSAREAEEARRVAEVANEAKSVFLATMSHEIRTPLNAIMAYTDILGMELSGPLTEAQRGQLGKIRSSSQHLLGIVDDVLDLSRVEAGRLVVNRTVLRPAVVASDALALVEPQAAARGVTLTDAVSAFAGGLAFWGDEERVRQILLNLLSNAIKFTPSAGRVTVSAGTAVRLPEEVEADGPGPWVYVRVEDTGAGIPDDRRAAIFEPFEQADMSLTRQHGGTGLGLAISRRLARLMGGDITVRSALGLGSSFFLWLPAAPEHQPASLYPQAQPGVGARPDSLPRRMRDAILADLEVVIQGYVARLRSDPGTASARALKDAELEDHFASLLSDLAATIGGLDLRDGSGRDALRDGTSIQRVIAQRHGEQRLRLGWREEELVREHALLREELTTSIRRRLPQREAECEALFATLDMLLASAERASLDAYRREAAS